MKKTPRTARRKFLCPLAPRLARWTAALALMIFAAIPAHAALRLSLTPALASVAPGGQVALLASLTNDGDAPVLLLGGTGQITGPANDALTLDDTAFLFDLPETPLEAGGSYSSSLYILAALTAPEGQFTADYQVDGELNGTPISASASSTITVAPATAAPEPAAFSLLAVGLLASSLKRRK